MPKPRAAPPSDFLARPGPLYSALAGALVADIQSGRYGVGAALPTEAELQTRFHVSRHTVRQAMRELQQQGYVATQHGIGTRVRARQAAFRFVHAAESMDDLMRFSQATRLRVVARRSIVADALLAETLRCSPGQAWFELSVLRYVPGDALPIGFLHTYLRPEFAGVARLIDSSGQAVFALVEQTYGVRLAEMEQEITSVTIEAAIARRLRSEAGSHGLQVTRRYRDDGGRLTQVSIGVYPAGRLVHTTQVQIQRGSA